MHRAIEAALGFYCVNLVCRQANEYIIIDTHVIKCQLGGNDNDIVMTFPNIEELN